MSFFQKIGAWFKGFNTRHNWKQIGASVVDAGEVAAAVVIHNPVGIATESIKLAQDAHAIKVEGDFPWNAPQTAGKAGTSGKVTP